MNFWGKLLVLLALAGFMVALPGCSGCWEDPIAKKKRLEEEEKKKKEKEEAEEKKKKEIKEDFEAEKVRVLPADEATVQAFYKPGHWTVANQAMVANNFDFRADVTTQAVYKDAPVWLENTPHALATSRGASLPKGQWKDIELLYYPPRSNSPRAPAPWMLNDVHASATGRQVFKRVEILSKMKPHEYFMLVLADAPDDYGFLKLIHSTQPPTQEAISSTAIAHYRVSLPKIDRLAPLSSNALTWTSVSVIVWDDLDPKVLTPDQQRAMLDWLHFGGQLVISGPRSYSTLQSSFLAEYLPAAEAESKNLTDDDFRDFNQWWTVTGKKTDRNDRVTTERLPIVIPDSSPLLGLAMTPHAEAYAPPGCQGLVLERRVGRGRICLTAFPLDALAIKNWPSFDSFVNAVLLRRPAREYYDDAEALAISLRYKDAAYISRREDPRLNSLLRYFTRDIESFDMDAPAPPPPPVLSKNIMFDEVAQEPEVTPPPSALAALDATDPRFGGWANSRESGIGGWNDQSGISTAARDVLSAAAGISIPKVDFVLRVLAIYLLVLAPVNWLIFRLVGRVELAWIAAPLIALVGAGAVVRLAQLDIGFARSQTDLAVLEMHEGYRRAHLTRYTALYTSLSTNYELEFADATALALPMADPNFKPSIGQRVSTVTLERSRHVTLGNFQVASNTTGRAHSEQMYDTGGSLDYDAERATLVNGTKLSLRNAAVLRRLEAGGLEVATLGVLKPGESRTLRFETSDSSNLAGLTRRLFPASESTDPDPANLDRMFRLAIEKLHLYPGEVRLVAWSDDTLAGLTVKPAAAQYFGRSMILAHLRHAPLPDPKPDANLRTDFKATNTVGDDAFPLLPGDDQEPPF